MRILVVGAGIAGLSAAHELSRTGHEVVIWEREADLSADGYMIDFFGPGFGAAERMGLLPVLAGIHQPISRFAFADPNGRVSAELSYPRLRRTVFQDRHMNFVRGDLARALHEHLHGRVQIHFGTSPVALDPEGSRVTVKASRGGSDSFDLVVGADGVRSHLRHLAFLAGETVTCSLRCHTAAFVVSQTVEGAPDDAFVMMSAPRLSAAVYPFRGGRTATFFLHDAEAGIADRSAAACRRELEAVYRGKGQLLDRILDLFPDGEGVYFDEVVQLEATRWSEGRVVLIGDAAGCVSLLAGQGASLAVYGGFVLAQELDRSAGDVERALARYEARVRPLVVAREKSGRRTKSWFLPRTRLGRALRDGVTDAVVRSPLAPLIGRYMGGRRASLD